MRLKYQLFLTLLLTGAILIALMAAIGRWNFERGFIGYINDTERQQLQPLIETLAQGYADAGGWQWITDNHNTWRVLLDTHLGRRRPSPDRASKSGIPPPNAKEIAGNKPPSGNRNNDNSDSNSNSNSNAIAIAIAIAIAMTIAPDGILPARLWAPSQWIPVCCWQTSKKDC